MNDHDFSLLPDTNDSDNKQTRKSKLLGILGMIVSLFLIAAIVVAGFAIHHIFSGPLPPEGCTVKLNNKEFRLQPDQAKYASIIVAESLRRKLPTKAATVALATAFQESNIQNISYGDRDSVGLFQQRPSQGWGTIDQIMDPWYSSGRFYQALAKVKNWQSMEISDAAQKVQISAYPGAYRQHANRAAAISAALSGDSQSVISCVDRSHNPGSPGVVKHIVTTALPNNVQLLPAKDGIIIKANDTKSLWAAINLALTNTAGSGLVAVKTSGQSWSLNEKKPAEWTGSHSDTTEAHLSFRNVGN